MGRGSSFDVPIAIESPTAIHQNNDGIFRDSRKILSTFLSVCCAQRWSILSEIFLIVRNMVDVTKKIDEMRLML
jgi:hypothetical protein